MGIGQDNLTENGFTADFYDESDYGHLESVLNWALQELRESDDQEVIERARSVMGGTEEYLESEYDTNGFKLDPQSSINGEEAYRNVRDEMKDKARGEYRPWERLDDVRYEIERLLECKES